MNNTIYRTWFWCGLFAFEATTAYVFVQLLQVAGMLNFPMDEMLIYGTSLCMGIPFVFELLALHYVARVKKKIWSHAALIFVVMYAVFVTANYAVQPGTVLPMKIRGDA